ncbi:Aste57867_17127 [Aphanomyces stellatus]|uniref:Aste57867_17127 protein n=1 Tax=Aphanomyces stellatus TaxID=120398 RepID=A0A485L8V8_9STRA|nr:hypothetical protein As57867_017068 [Aphanomyces stellatus]VFT93885.1 Aste57867_17127 [Aphanomyces stellatus]
MRKSTIKSLYKCILRDVRKMTSTPGFRLRQSVVPEQWGHGLLHPERDPMKPSPYLSEEDNARWLRLQKFLAPHGDDIDLVDLVRTKFREGASITYGPALAGRLDEMMWALQEVSHQRILAESSSVTTTDNITVDATGHFIDDHSDASANHFRYTYRIRVYNDSTDIIRITGRHYIFDHGNQKREIVPRHSAQVVGLTPTIKPGEMFEYASGVILETISGSVRGCLHAVRLLPDGSEEPFDVAVAPFSLQPTVRDAMMLQ